MRKLNGGFMAAIAVALLASGFNAEARLGKSGSTSRSSGYSSPTRPSGATAPRPYTPAPSRVGGGTSGGMQRSDAMSQAQTMRQAPTPAGSTGTSASAAGAAGGSSMIGRNVGTAAPVNPGAAPGAAAAPSGLSTGQILGGAAVGAIGGYALSRAMAPDAVPPASAPAAGEVTVGSVFGSGNNAGKSASAQDALGGAGAGMPSDTAITRGSFSMMPILLLMAALAAGGFYFFKKKSGAVAGGQGRASPFGSNSSVNTKARFATASPTSSTGLGMGQVRSAQLDFPEEELLEQAPGLYRRLQDANNAADKAQLKRLVDESYLPELLSAFPNRVEPSRTRVLSLEIKGNRVLDFQREGPSGRMVGSIYFVAELDESDGNPTHVEEVWHFVKSRSSLEWKLAGIQEVA